MFNFSLVRMAGALKIHLHPILISSKLVKLFFESVKFIPENVKTFFVNKTISYLLFRVYSMEELMIKAATTMAAVRMERAEVEQQFIIPCPRENSWGHKRVLDKKKIIREFVGYTPVMNKRKDAECMTTFLDAVIVNGVQDPGLTSFEEFLPRSAPLVDFLSIGQHSGAGWKYPSANTIHAIQKDQGLFFQMWKEVEVKEIIAGVSSHEEILEIKLWMEEQHAKDQAIFPT